jgi:AcrR family transcriptional regulator
MTIRTKRRGADQGEPDFEARRQPTQARSRATVARIRDAAAYIIENEGMARLNSNRIAEVARVSLGSIYKFFPNKESILKSILQMWREENEQVFQEVMRIRPSDTLVERIQGWFEFIIQTEASHILTAAQATQFYPELKSLDDAYKDPAISMISDMLRRDGCRLTGDALRLAALRIIDLGYALLLRMHNQKTEDRAEQMRWTMVLMRAAVEDSVTATP